MKRALLNGLLALLASAGLLLSSCDADKTAEGSDCQKLEDRCDDCISSALADECESVVSSGSDCAAGLDRFQICGSPCHEAVAFCEVCEVQSVAGQCADQLGSASEDYCQAAVETYSMSCQTLPR